MAAEARVDSLPYAHLQPHVARPATLCDLACNPMQPGLLPYATRPATPCALSCNSRSASTRSRSSARPTGCATTSASTWRCAATLCGRGCNPTSQGLQPYGIAQLVALAYLQPAAYSLRTTQVTIEGQGGGGGSGHGAESTLVPQAETRELKVVSSK